MMARFVVTALAACLVGCSVEAEYSTKKSAKNENRGDKVESWANQTGDGVPHRMSILRDGTEILTLGQHNHGRWLFMVRYSGEPRFQIISDEGEIQRLVAEDAK